jgi:hypothetical protein
MKMSALAAPRVPRSLNWPTVSLSTARTADASAVRPFAVRLAIAVSRCA